MLWSSFLQKQALSGSVPEICHAVLIISVLRKKTEFNKGESNRKVIVIAAGGLGESAPPAGRFSHYGGHSFPSNFFLSS